MFCGSVLLKEFLAHPLGDLGNGRSVPRPPYLAAEIEDCPTFEVVVLISILARLTLQEKSRILRLLK